MSRLLAVLAIGIALLAAGCGGNSKRAAVATYIKRVNAVEKKLATPFAEVSQANQSFAGSKRDPQLDAQLAKAAQTMQTLRGDLAKVQAPPEAKRLHTLLLELVDHEVELTGEVEQLATFVPSFQAALKPLAPADSSLQAELRRTAKGAVQTKALDAEKTAALDGYANTLDAVIASLRGLDPPPVWRPGYDDQLTALLQLQSSARALAKAIRANRAAAIPGLLHRFDAAAVADQSVAAQRQQIAAVKAYNGRIKALITLAKKIETEEGRLQRAYG